MEDDVSAAVHELDGHLRELQAALVEKAAANTETIMPGFTHLQSAQPIVFGHHLLAYVEMLARDRRRFCDVLTRSEGYVVDEPDVVIETVAAAATCAMHLSRFAEEIVIWNSAQFNFIKLSDAFTSGSSIMPQKKNPDAAELVRAKTGRIYGALFDLLTAAKGLPLGGLAAGREPLFEALAQLALSVRAMTGMVRDMQPNKQRMRESAAAAYATATDLADWCVRELGLPFRKAHEVAGRLVALADGKGAELHELSLDEMQAVEPALTAAVYEVLPVEASVAYRTSYGGTAPVRVREQAARWRNLLQNEFKDLTSLQKYNIRNSEQPTRESIMNIYEQVAETVNRIAIGMWADPNRVVVDIPKPAHGDAATNLAMVAAGQLKRPPMEIAEEVAAKLRAEDYVAEATVAKPGFVNIKIKPAAWQAELPAVLAAGADYGRSNIGKDYKINLEYGSCNPTAPMIHVGHCRGIVFGDALANLLEFAGYAVTREYYINDAGEQIRKLVDSLLFRRRELLGEETGEIPAGLYPGDYLIPPAQQLVDKYGDGQDGFWPPEDFDPAEFVIDEMMAGIRADLARLRVSYDVFFSEKSLHEPDEAGETAVGKAVAAVIENDPADIYTGTLPPPKGKEDGWVAEEQLLFRATEYGDDVDRALRKADGSWTYFASDLAYVAAKAERGFDEAVYVLGSDHSGYQQRLEAAGSAVGSGMKMRLMFVQMVKLVKDGQALSMSKRDGTYVTVGELIDEIGVDAARFMMLYRKNDGVQTIDFEKVAELTKDNPVFYCQYAHARCRSVFRQWGGDEAAVDGSADLSLLDQDSELAVLKKVAEWPRTVDRAAKERAPHRIAFYLYELASALHHAWHCGNDDPALKFIVADEATTMARLTMVKAVQNVLRLGLGLLKVTAPEEMR